MARAGLQSLVVCSIRDDRVFKKTGCRKNVVKPGVNVIRHKPRSVIGSSAPVLFNRAQSPPTLLYVRSWLKINVNCGLGREKFLQFVKV